MPLFSLFQFHLQRVVEIKRISATNRNQFLVRLTKRKEVLSFETRLKLVNFVYCVAEKGHSK